MDVCSRPETGPALPTRQTGVSPAEQVGHQDRWQVGCDCDLKAPSPCSKATHGHGTRTCGQPLEAVSSFLLLRRPWGHHDRYQVSAHPAGPALQIELACTAVCPFLVPLSGGFPGSPPPPLPLPTSSPRAPRATAPLCARSREGGLRSRWDVMRWKGPACLPSGLPGDPHQADNRLGDGYAKWTNSLPEDFPGAGTRATRAMTKADDDECRLARFPTTTLTLDIHQMRTLGPRHMMTPGLPDDSQLCFILVVGDSDGRLVLRPCAPGEDAQF